jgi:hypothetical protein
MKFHLTKKSTNVKTGPIPVSTSSNETCPTTCALLQSGACYAKLGPLGLHWNKVSNGERGLEWKDFLNELTRLPSGQLWRHNQAGDLPGKGNDLDVQQLDELVQANSGRRGFTYTHKVTTETAEHLLRSNRQGFTINLSANSLDEADRYTELKAGPVVTVLPYDFKDEKFTTPKGNRGVVCPAQTREDVSCSTCQLCQRADRNVIVGFIAHGVHKKKVA